MDMDLPSHGRGRWFEPSIAHSKTCWLGIKRVGRTGGGSHCGVLDPGVCSG
jgi:hypothetical protein